MTEAQIDALEQAGEAQDRIQVDSPIGGVVIEKLVHEGDYVKTGTPLYRVAELDRVWVKIDVYEQDGLIERAKRMGHVMRGHMERLYEKHPSLGSHRNIGLFGILELVRDRETYEPMAPYGGMTDEMKAVAKHLKDNGLYTFVRFNTIHCNPPLTISEEEMAEGFDILDGALDHADKGVRA